MRNERKKIVSNDPPISNLVCYNVKYINDVPTSLTFYI